MRWSILLPLLALAGCVAAPRPVADVAYYDLGPPMPPPAAAPALALRSVEVVAPSWLDGPSLNFRLLYADATRRQSYAKSRWAAPPGELLEAVLRRAMTSSEIQAPAQGCRLRVDLDELAQVFRSPQESEGVIEVQVSLLAPHSDMLLARQRFSISQPAPSADARGGVGAISAGVARLGVGLRDWMDALDRDGQPGLNIARTCRGP
jgi:cholesterol transport system auxiliary component